MNSPLFSSLSSNSRKQLQSNWSLALPRSRQLPWLRYRLPAATPSQRVLISYILLLNWLAEITYRLSVIGKRRNLEQGAGSEGQPPACFSACSIGVGIMVVDVGPTQ
jgi:hypothetical protein